MPPHPEAFGEANMARRMVGVALAHHKGSRRTPGHFHGSFSQEDPHFGEVDAWEL